MRGVLSEYGIVMPQGAKVISRRLPELLEEAESRLQPKPEVFFVLRGRALARGYVWGCDLARLRNRVGANPTRVAVSRGPGIEPCSQRGNSLIDA